MRPLTHASLHSDLNRRGWTVVEHANLYGALVQIAQAVGEVIELEHGSPIEILKPRGQRDARTNTTSATFGLGAFPLHTDMAHWPVPPRFLAFRARNAVRGVPTQLVHRRSLRINNATMDLLRRAVWRVEGVRKPYLCSMYFDHEGESGLRWDTCTMRPHGEIAGEAQAMLLQVLGAAFRSERVEHEWSSENQVLIVDNWHVLHARPDVPVSAMARELERVLIGG